MTIEHIFARKKRGEVHEETENEDSKVFTVLNKVRNNSQTWTWPQIEFFWKWNAIPNNFGIKDYAVMDKMGFKTVQRKKS